MFSIFSPELLDHDYTPNILRVAPLFIFDTADAKFDFTIHENLPNEAQLLNKLGIKNKEHYHIIHVEKKERKKYVMRPLPLCPPREDTPEPEDVFKDVEKELEEVCQKYEAEWARAQDEQKAMLLRQSTASSNSMPQAAHNLPQHASVQNQPSLLTQSQQAHTISQLADKTSHKLRSFQETGTTVRTYTGGKRAILLEENDPCLKKRRDS